MNVPREEERAYHSSEEGGEEANAAVVSFW